MSRRAALAWAAVGGLGLVAALVAGAEARPGGGHSYSGGGYSGGGASGGYSGGGSSYSGGDGGGELAYLLIRLIIEAPHIGIPVTAVIIGAYLWVKRETGADRTASWDSVAILPPPPPPPVDKVRELDPDFSLVLLEDFLFRLVSQAHRSRHDAAALAGLAPYLSARARAHLSARAPVGVQVDQVVIGSLRVGGLMLPPAAPDPDAGGKLLTTSDDGRPYYVKLSVDVEATVAVGVASERTIQYTREQWQLAREARARSRPPERARDFNCPNCGAPFQSSDEQTCGHCGEVVHNGRFDWTVGGIQLFHSQARPPLLGGYAPEVGTYGDTITHPRLQAELGRLKADDPAFTDDALASRLTRIYTELNAGWSEQDPARMRPFVSDGLQDHLRYWLEAYERQKMINRLEDMTITGWRYVKVTRDRHFDAITVRLWAKGLDFTISSEDGRLVGGSRTKPRAYSEYWTLVRGAAVRGAPRSDKRCPNCGADLKISMAGSCEYCQVHVTSGEFDWVLSKIEQDEAYRG